MKTIECEKICEIGLEDSWIASGKGPLSRIEVCHMSSRFRKIMN